jgi:hypothetical protein
MQNKGENMKKKLLLVLGLTFIMSACSLNESYVSLRHPENGTNVSTEEKEKTTDQSTEIEYTEKNKEEKPVGNFQSNDEAMDDELATEEDDDTINFTVEDTVNMRIAPSKDSEIVVEIEPDGDILKIGENGDWTRVTYEGYTGYVLTELLIPKNE